MNIIKVKVNFEKGVCDTTGINLITGDYNSTKMVFDFVNNPTGIKILEMKSPSDSLVYVGEIINNEVILVGKKPVTTVHEEVTYTKYVDNEDNVYWYDEETEKIYNSEFVEQQGISLDSLTIVMEDASLFSEDGTYIFEISLYGDNSKLTSVYSKIKVKPEQVLIDGEYVTQYLPIFDQLLNEVAGTLEDMDETLVIANAAINAANNLNIDASKSGKVATVTLTKKDASTKVVTLSDGTSLMFNWDGTKLGIKTDEDEDYTYVDLQGIQGETGPMGAPFTIKKTYSSVAEMNADFNNMEVGDYVMITSTVETEDNAKLYCKGTEQWIFITDFSGATGIQGPTGATPNISIGTVTSGDTPNVTRTGTNENPILNFTLVKGDKGDTGNTGPTGNGISSITKTSTSGYVDTYTITYTNGTTSTFEVTNGEVSQEQLDKVQRQVDYDETAINTLPITSTTGTDITLNGTAEAPLDIVLSPSALEQDTSTQSSNLFDENKYLTVSFTTGTYKYALANFKGNRTLYVKSQLKAGKTAISGLYVAITNNGSQPNSGTTKYAISNGNVSAGDTSKDFTGYDNLYIAFYPTSKTWEEILEVYDIWVATTDDSYTPFTPDSPSPDYPQDIRTITGDNTIVVEGKNLLPNNYVELPSIAVEKSDGTIVFNGTLSSNTSYQLKRLTLPAGTYIFSSNKSFPNESYFLINNYSAGNTKTFTLEEETYFEVRLVLLAGTYTNSSCKLQIEKGSTATTYKPYTSQTLPINLGTLEYCKIGNYADEFVKAVSKKNLFNESQLLLANNWSLNSSGYYNGTFTDFHSKWGTNGFNVNIDGSKQYTISLDYYVSGGNAIIRFIYSDDTYSNYNLGSTTLSHISLTSTYGKTISKIIGSYTTGGSNTLYIKNIMLNEGLTALPYEPYPDNKWYLKKNIGKAILDETGYWSEYIPTSENWRQYYKPFNLIHSTEVSLARSDYFINNIIGNRGSILNSVYTYNGGIAFNPAGINSMEAWKTWISTHNTTVYYVNATPEYVLLNDTLQGQLEDISYALGYDNQTNIIQVNDNLPFIISATGLKPVPTKTSELQNDSGFLTSSDITNVAYKNADNNFSTGQTINGDLQVYGDITNTGSSYETHAEKIYTKDDYIVTRDGAVSGLGSGDYTGFEATKYDGTNNGRLVFDNTGTARVGDVGDEVPLLARDESSNMTNNYLMAWDSTNLVAKTVCGIAFVTQAEYDALISGGTYDNNTLYMII